MSALEIAIAGIATSVQDAGRFGAQRYGLPPSGAMDRLSLAAANSLVGSGLLTAAIEIGPAPVTLVARGGTLNIAITGALRHAMIGSAACPLYHCIELAKDASLMLGAARKGMFSYLAVAGSIKGEPVFGSVSVNARAGLGSPLPRPLRGGDLLEIERAAAACPARTLAPPVFHNGPIRVIRGPQADEFGDAYMQFLESEWSISPSSDRMGYRLEGPMLSHGAGFNIVSDGTVDGSIQVSGNGQPIVLMKDRGTTGGYPKIATIISSDLGRFAQNRPHQSIRFEVVGVDEAQREARLFHDLIESLPGRVRLRAETSHK
ncbi:MAG: biotin-dependent carboxyltransferase family protein [Xanthobacteraceae bacterium]|nr:biotin-dependent carboxyltransferase family protein [Xanthobacteraceae bacterium]